MAEEASNQTNTPPPPTAQESVVQVEEVVLTDVPKTTVPVERDSQPQPEPEPEKKPVEENVTLETHLSKPNTDDSTDDKIPEFKEESTKLSELPENENKALQELKKLVQEALNNHEFFSKEEKKPPPPPTTKAKEEPSSPLPPEEVSIWGIPLLADERSDVILLKFLRAREFKVKEALVMLKNTIRWRKEFKMEELMEEKLGDELEKVVFMHGSDKEGHPVCYNIYGEFQNKELYKKTFSDEEKREKFLRWRIQFLEKSIRKLDFNPGGICTIFQVNDLKNSPGPAKWELRQATKNALQLLQDNYPEFVAKQVFINVPWWYLAVNRMISPFLTQRTKSKFVFAGPSKSTETLLRYIAPEQIPVKYGGLSKDGEFGNNDAVTEITVRPAAKHTVEFPVTENCLLSWELRVIGWEVSYGAEFVPSSEGSYTVIVQKARKVASSEDPVLCSSFKVGEPGKVVLTIDNTSSKKKKLLYRLKTKSSD
uniref:Patellin-3 n=1 Tax=Cajanus cajan TaxID=3821 RepID=A0A151S2I8_CAJCA|nr:Patellin-3 [Cajanus cajan]